MIRLENLTKEYDVMGASREHSSVIAADHLNLEIAEKEIFGLVGPNGAGKTTTLKMVCGLLVPTAGRVTVNGIDVEQEPEEAQRHIGYLADFFAVYDDLKVWEYLDYFARAYKMNPALIRDRIDFAIQRTGLEVKRHQFVSGLSRGMKQRLGIARAILHDPPVLVLDEPASGLDPKARLELKDLIRELSKQGKTVFITSHVLSDLEEICTSVGILEKGHLVRVGKLAQVMQADTPGKRIRIRLVSPAAGGAAFPLGDFLSAQAGVSGVTPEGEAGVLIQFTGGEAEIAHLVRELVSAGAPVCGVEEITETLEQIFSRVSSGEVM
jgi:ABC-2 type transport system ATP-binding protein